MSSTVTLAVLVMSPFGFPGVAGAVAVTTFAPHEPFPDTATTPVLLTTESAGADDVQVT
jgi:hypothetical protein